MENKMVKWRDQWSLELSEIFNSIGLDLRQQMLLIPAIMNSNMISQLEVKQGVINQWSNGRGRS